MRSTPTPRLALPAMRTQTVPPADQAGPVVPPLCSKDGPPRTRSISSSGSADAEPNESRDAKAAIAQMGELERGAKSHGQEVQVAIPREVVSPKHGIPSSLCIEWGLQESEDSHADGS